MALKKLEDLEEIENKKLEKGKRMLGSNLIIKETKKLIQGLRHTENKMGSSAPRTKGTSRECYHQYQSHHLQFCTSRKSCSRHQYSSK